MSLNFKDDKGEIDLRTIRGLTFLTDHKETPGLGKEMEREDWRATFSGKKTHDSEGNLKSITVIKGKVAGSKYDKNNQHYVDGLGGATLTCIGISAMLRRCLEYYQPFLNKVRNKEVDLTKFKPTTKAGE